jgi:hypothetical protein
MIRNSARTRTLLAGIALVGSAVAVNCSNKGNSPATDGSLKLALKSAGLQVNSVHYVIQNSATPPATIRSGDINTSDDQSTPSVFVNVPAGTGYKAVLTADIVPATGNASYCTGTSDAFSIVAGQAQMVTVQLVCGGGTPPQNQGSANINGSVVAGDNCPLLTSWMASPLQTSAPNGQIDVSAGATDGDASETLTFTWTATNGTFAQPTSTATGSGTSTTKYTCTTIGAQTLTVTVTDNHVPSTCSVHQDFPVNCASTVFCGNGTVDQASEQCDHGAMNGHDGSCDANCQNVPQVCGDGFVQSPETCDHGAQNGHDGLCDANCQVVVAMCGDGFLQTGEDCDPSNIDPTNLAASTCTTSKCCGTNCKFSFYDQSPQCQACEQKTYSSGAAKFTCVQSLYSNATGFACQAFTGSLKTNCDTLRTCILTKHCRSGNDPTPCYCGALDATTCVAQGAPTTAPCYAEYQAALAGGPAGTVFDLFTDPTSPVGVANNLLTCDVDATCACGQ